MGIFNFFKPKPQKVEDVSNEPKSIYHIFQEQIDTGMAEHKRSPLGLFVSAFAAGLEVGFTLFLAGIMYTLLHDHVSEDAMHLILSISYPIGFIFVVIGRSELFTEHTTLAVIPVLQGATNLRSLLKLWGVIYLGNLLGGYIMAFILAYLGPDMGIISQEAFYHLAHKLTKYDWVIILGSSILAGWLMGQLSWLVTSSQETISRVIMVILVTALIGVGGLHHSIVGSIEVLAGVLVSDKLSMMDYLHFQFFTTIGNIIGGVVFVSIIKFSAIKLSFKGNKENISDKEKAK
ncbi:formate/nitrite transporter family protein [Fulvivirga sediminis]|uniref:Formate/nitrite transporter family protein n=1 Tax=Fulvivirga sediminis TaxID=2803949 RepID=A0A937F3M9_9BACT|nr:formate/nitrite transporter family protein [Fulvivirga sediminis]MBL3655742.1 formate/nitrite transporter family protein [Fulvivirga sediminis]